MKAFDVIYEGLQYKGFTLMDTKGSFATIYPEIWAGSEYDTPIHLTPAGVQRSSPEFWNCVFENESDGSPIQLALDIGEK